MESTTSHPAYGPEVQARLASIRSGNAPEVIPDPSRDLSLRKGEYWETRLVPKHPHHFTASEFEAYLLQHRFPSNTIRDRLVEQIQCIRRALLRGDFVPAEVLSDSAGVDALDLAEMDILAQAEDAFKQSKVLAARTLFETALGYYTPGGDPSELKRWLLIRAARADNNAYFDGIHDWPAGGFKLVSLGGYPRQLRIALRSGANQAHWVEVQDTTPPAASLYAPIYRFSYEEVDQVMRQAVAAGEITLDDARSLLGASWQPSMRVACVTLD